MKRLISLFFSVVLISLLTQNVYALEFDAPEAPVDVQKYIPEEEMTFGDGVWHLFKSAVVAIRPEFLDAVEVCLSLVAIAMLLSVASQYAKVSKQIIRLISAACIGLLFFRSVKSFVCLGIETIEEMSDYGKLLLPVLTAATAANGTVSTSAALYSGCYIFVTILTTLISKLIVPLIYIYMALSIAGSATREDSFSGLKKFVKWLSSWSLKTILLVYSGYMGITKVISGSVDAAAVKATKMTINGAVPVVGSALADASETILLSAGLMKNSVGIYGLFAVAAICLVPFFKIAIQYLLLKLTAAICGVFSTKEINSLLQDMIGAMGLVLAMTGAVCLLLLISIVCFIRCSV